MSPYRKVFAVAAILGIAACSSTPDASETAAPYPKLESPDERMEARGSETRDPNTIESYQQEIREQQAREDARRAAARERDRELNDRPVPPPEPAEPEEPEDPPEPSSVGEELFHDWTIATASDSEIPEVERIWDAIDFDLSRGEVPEGIAFDEEGRLYVGSAGPSGTLVHRDR